MPTDLHFICKHGLNHEHLEGNAFETGEWVVSEQVADEAVGGRIYLHERQNDPAWHGGTITAWRTEEDDRKVFSYVVDGPFRVRCTENWGREKAIIRR